MRCLPERSAPSLIHGWHRSAWRRISAMAAMAAKSCLRCSASSWCWSRERSGASAACKTPSSPPKRCERPQPSASHDRSGAADQPRQLLEAATDAIGDEIDHLVLEHQHQLAAAASKVGCRQHARPRRRYQMRHAKCRAEQARAFDHGWRHQVANKGRRFVLFAQAGVAVEYRQRDESPALMAYGAEISIGDEIERFLAAVIGMYPPADIRQQAGGMAQAAILVGFPQP